MVKKNVLTPVLAGVLGVAVVGSGVGYYVMSKKADGDANQKSKNESTVVVSPKLSVMAENISNTIDKAAEIAKGDVDYAYEGSFNISFGPALTNNMPTAPKDFGMTVSSKQKGGNEGGDIVLTYGGEKLVTVNQVYSRENGDDMYVRVPELSDAYIKVNKADAESYLKDSMGMDLSQYTQAAESIDFDADAFEADLKEYEQLVKDNFPESKESGTKSGDIDGISYEYTSKSYELTSADGQKIVTAVLEKAKTDENFKKLYDQGVEAAGSQVASSDESSIPSYEESIDKMLEEVKGEIEGEDTVILETYENGDGQFAGFNLKPADKDGELKLITVSNENAEGLDMNFDSGDGTIMKAYGALKSENDVVNGSYTVSSTEDGKETMKVVYTMTDMKNVGENFSGTIRMDLTSNEGSEAQSGWMEIKSDSTADDVNITFDFGFAGENAFTMTMTSKKTEASDVELPGGDAKIFNALDEEQMNQYLETCDTQGFMTKMKDTLGDEMYNSLFGGSASSYSSGSSSYNDSDYDYDFDYDDDDFNWEDFDTATESSADKPA